MIPIYAWSLTRVTKSYLSALGTIQISSFITKHWTKFLTHQTGNYPVTCFVSNPSRITLVVLSISRSWAAVMNCCSGSMCSSEDSTQGTRATSYRLHGSHLATSATLVDHTDQERICPEISRPWRGNRFSLRCVKTNETAKIIGSFLNLESPISQENNEQNVRTPYCLPQHALGAELLLILKGSRRQ